MYIILCLYIVSNRLLRYVHMIIYVGHSIMGCTAAEAKLHDHFFARKKPKRIDRKNRRAAYDEVPALPKMEYTKSMGWIKERV